MDSRLQVVVFFSKKKNDVRCTFEPKCFLFATTHSWLAHPTSLAFAKIFRRSLLSRVFSVREFWKLTACFEVLNLCWLFSLVCWHFGYRESLWLWVVSFSETCNKNLCSAHTRTMNSLTREHSLIKCSLAPNAVFVLGDKSILSKRRENWKVLAHWSESKQDLTAEQIKEEKR